MMKLIARRFAVAVALLMLFTPITRASAGCVVTGCDPEPQVVTGCDPEPDFYLSLVLAAAQLP